MVQESIPAPVLATYRAAVGAHYAAGWITTPCEARAGMMRALLAAPGFGLRWWREHQEEIQEFWQREERVILLERPKVLQP